jgi:hypothetical protein
MRKNTGVKQAKETTPQLPEVQPEEQTAIEEAPGPPITYRNLYGPASVRFQSRFGSRFGSLEPLLDEWHLKALLHKSRDRFSGPIREPDADWERLTKEFEDRAVYIPALREFTQLGVEKGHIEELVKAPSAKTRRRKRKRDGNITKAVEMRRNAPPGTDLEKYWRVVFPKCIPGHKRMTNLKRLHAQKNLRSAVRVREQRDREEGQKIATT